MKIPASANHVLKTTSVESPLLSAPCVQSTQYPPLNLLSALHVQKDTPGKSTFALNVQIITLETESLAVSVQKEPFLPQTKRSAKSLQ